MRKEGAFLVEDYLSLAGGLNSSDSPFIVQPTQASDGYNYEYLQRGGVTKRLGISNSLTFQAITNAGITCLGLGIWDPIVGQRSLLRAGTAPLTYSGQVLASSALGTLASLGEIFPLGDDTKTGHSHMFAVGSQQPVNFAPMNTALASATWLAGGGFLDPSDLGANTLLGVTSISGTLFSDGQLTTNGVPQAPVTTTFSVVATTSSIGYIAAPCYLTYSFSLVKASTGAEGNCLPEAIEALNGSVFVTQVTAGTTTTNATSFKVNVTAQFLSLDTTKYQYINVYKSQPTFASTGQLGTPDPGFTAGVFMGQVPTSALTLSKVYITDFGLDTAPPGVQFGWAYSPHGTTTFPTSPALAYTNTSANVPRAGNLELDQSFLPSATYNTVVSWNGRLATATGSTVYVSDTEKPEAWPLSNIFTVPSGGPITGLAVVGLSSGVAGVGINEALVIFKEREMWTLLSNGAPYDYTTWQLSYMSASGCPSQRLVVNTDHGIFWLNNRGIFSWNGASKPLYLSQPIEDKFTPDGDIVYSTLYQGFGIFYQQKKQIIWTVGSNTYGNQQYQIKLDLRLTMMQTAGNLTETITHGIFNANVLTVGLYAGTSATPSYQGGLEYVYYGDNSGFLYQGDTGTSDTNSGAIAFQYSTPVMTMGTPTTRKRFNKVVVWVTNVGQPSLSLQYWSDWRATTTPSGAITQAVTSAGTGADDIWDLMLWDVGEWDPGTYQVQPVVFNLNSQVANNCEGQNLRLQFTANDAAYTPTILGYSVYYTEAGPSQ